MAQRYDEVLDAGARIVAVSVDTVQQQAAMVDKLQLPFAMLSDPGGTDVLRPLDAFNPDERDGIGKPGVFVVTPDGDEAIRQVGADFADRISEDELIEHVRALDLPPTSQPEIAVGTPEPGPQAMPVRALLPYFRGAKFGAKAMGLRHPEATDSAARLGEQLDRYVAAVRTLRERTGE